MSPWFWLLFLLYWVPSIVAAVRHKPDLGAIAVLNFFLGWTIIGWVIALVWALTHDRPEPQQVVYVSQPPTAGSDSTALG